MAWSGDEKKNKCDAGSGGFGSRQAELRAGHATACSSAAAHAPNNQAGGSRRVTATARGREPRRPRVTAWQRGRGRGACTAYPDTTMLGVVSSRVYAEHKLLIFGQLRPGEFKGGCETTYCGCLAAPIGILCLVVYRVDLLRRSVWSASVAVSQVSSTDPLSASSIWM
eukprot:COSAG06_NODE_8287_length_2215_cov_3.228261_2_plen_168_part_00